MAKIVPVIKVTINIVISPDGPSHFVNIPGSHPSVPASNPPQVTGAL